MLAAHRRRHAANIGGHSRLAWNPAVSAWPRLSHVCKASGSGSRAGRAPGPRPSRVCSLPRPGRSLPRVSGGELSTHLEVVSAWGVIPLCNRRLMSTWLPELKLAARVLGRDDLNRRAKSEGRRVRWRVSVGETSVGSCQADRHRRWHGGRSRSIRRRRFSARWRSAIRTLGVTPARGRPGRLPRAAAWDPRGEDVDMRAHRGL